MPLAGERQAILLLAENVLIELDVSLAVLRQEGGGVLDGLQHLVAHVVDVDVDADGADQPLRTIGIVVHLKRRAPILSS